MNFPDTHGTTQASRLELGELAAKARAATGGAGVPWRGVGADCPQFALITKEAHHGTTCRRGYQRREGRAKRLPMRVLVRGRFRIPRVIVFAERHPYRLPPSDDESVATKAVRSRRMMTTESMVRCWYTN
jgi:hypothetical protein